MDTSKVNTSLGSFVPIDVEAVRGASLRGLSVPDVGVAWVSGSAGAVARTSDSGVTWTDASIPEAVQDDLDLRCLVAFDSSEAWAASAGEGEASRLFHTTDGGATWSTVLRNVDPAGFYDGLAFWTRQHGMLLGDPTDGYMTILVTEDGGETWERVGDAATFALPAPDPMVEIATAVEPAEPEPEIGEYCFAASNQSIETMGRSTAWIGTGGKVARVFKTLDRGRTWTVAATPMRQDDAAAGVFALSFRDFNFGVAVGGKYNEPDSFEDNCAITEDGGATWTLVQSPPEGYRSSVCFIPGQEDAWMSVGTNGSSIAEGSSANTWINHTEGGPGTALNSLAADPQGRTLWAVGADGFVARRAAAVKEVVWE
jgi:photosystem II stability/assembly factor-like uncharacterized protein